MIMTDRDKTQKAFNQCTDALSTLDSKSILKVFHLLSIHFDIVPPATIDNKQEVNQKGEVPSTQLLSEENNNEFEEVENQKNDKKASASKKVKSNGNSKQPVYLAEFDFKPRDKEVLKDFFERCNTSSNMSKNLVFIYYLKEILKVENVTTDHVYSCYRHLKLKIPQFPQTLSDTKRLKGWIDTSNSNDLKVTRTGINDMEHEILRSDDSKS